MGIRPIDTRIVLCKHSTSLNCFPTMWRTNRHVYWVIQMHRHRASSTPKLKSYAKTGLSKTIFRVVCCSLFCWFGTQSVIAQSQQAGDRATHLEQHANNNTRVGAGRGRESWLGRSWFLRWVIEWLNALEAAEAQDRGSASFEGETIIQNVSQPLTPLSVTHLCFLAISPGTHHAMSLLIAWPAETMATNGIDIFACPDLPQRGWSLALSTNVDLSAGMITWSDETATTHHMMHYALSSREDTDGDGIADGREFLLHRTDPANPDTIAPAVCLQAPVHQSEILWIP